MPFSLGILTASLHFVKLDLQAFLNDIDWSFMGFLINLQMFELGVGLC